MISVILYGRNDTHGYNYHKRLAISLNCIAEVLSGPQDEIIFADYNTPDDFPTVIEAIQDTLSQKAKKLIRILRIRPSYHNQFNKTHLPILETVARNVAIRRSNPNNKWILSTNPDMIFVPVEGSLTTTIASLLNGFYLLPRFALPEGLWETALDRSSPQKNLSFLKENSRKLHLNITVRRPGFLKYDNPGDFQLMLRDDIFRIGGFDEEMVKGWHVDSNLCKRMSLLGRTGESLEKKLTAFHCNHNQLATLFHSKVDENDWGRFVTDVASPELSNPNWGLPHEAIEEIRLEDRHTPALFSALSSSSQKDHEVMIHLDTFNTHTYDPARIFVYLADHFCHLPKNSDVGYIGYNKPLVEMLDTYLKARDFTGKILCLERFNEELPSTAWDELLAKSYLFICDFGFVQNKERGGLKKVMNAFFKIIQQRKTARFIGINVLHTDFHVMFSRHLIVRNNSHSPGICYGVLPQKRKPPCCKLISILHYTVARYLFNYSNQIRSRLSHLKMSKRLFRGSVE